MRINRYIARSGVTSRRKAEELILNGLVTVNDKKITNLAIEIETDKDVVKINGKIISLPRHVYLVFNKPAGYTTTKSDPFSGHNIFELLPKDNSLIAVGRLDRDTSGLIIITNDGDFAQNIIHPAKKIEKEYRVATQRSVSNDQVNELLRGLELEDGVAKAVSAKKTTAKELIITIEMGRKRVIKRMIEALGNKVTGLQRIRIGAISLDIPVGKYRKLTQEEIEPYI